MRAGDRLISQYWQRNIEVVIGTRRYTYPEFDIEFKIEFDTTPIPNEGEVILYNLNRDSLNNIVKGAGIIVNAGYGNDIGVVISGVIASVRTTYNGMDRITTIKTLDVPNQHFKKRINYMYKGNPSAEHLIRDILYYAGGVKPNTLQLRSKKNYPRGFHAKGTCIDLVTRIAQDCGSRVSIHNNVVDILEAHKGTEMAYVLGSREGLMSVEPIDEEGNPASHKVTCLLNHALTPYSLIQMRSLTLNGYVMVVKGNHNGSDFTSELEVRRV
ncbi:phage protein [Clostridium botulinum]|uniref:phage protein n=1 Tax=Clostridium botulinum TaxID=1491 RepID=UPI000774E663|nr:hypothetical protein [Clostridium botulinum]